MCDDADKPPTAMTTTAGVAPLVLRNLNEYQRFAQVAIAAGIGSDGDNRTSVAKAVIAIEYGAEMGIPPMHALQGVYIVHGKPAMQYAMIGALIKSSGRYNYKVEHHSDEACRIIFYQLWEGTFQECGPSMFSIDDAKTAGLLGSQPWKKYPRNMLFARALTNGARWYCPDIFGGAVYTPEELEHTEAPEPAPEAAENPEPESPPAATGQTGPAEQGKTEPPIDNPASDATIVRLDHLCQFAKTVPKAGKVVTGLRDALAKDDAGRLTQGEAGAIIDKAKGVLGPLGWTKDWAPGDDDDRPPEPPHGHDCNKEGCKPDDAGICMYCGDGMPF
jgi:hypothetical protein